MKRDTNSSCDQSRSRLSAASQSPSSRRLTAKFRDQGTLNLLRSCARTSALKPHALDTNEIARVFLIFYFNAMREELHSVVFILNMQIRQMLTRTLNCDQALRLLTYIIHERIDGNSISRYSHDEKSKNLELDSFNLCWCSCHLYYSGRSSLPLETLTCTERLNVRHAGSILRF